MGTQKRQAVARVLERMEQAKPRGPAWYQRIDPKHQATLDELAEAWLAGRLGSEVTGAARAVSATLQDLGVTTVGWQGVKTWLQRLRGW